MAVASRQTIKDITECPVCTETFTDPKVLPCIHTFCLKCLQTCGKDSKPGDEVSCPLCRTKFTVPLKGFLDLPNNFFVNKLLLINLNETSSEALGQLCDSCLALDSEVAATSYCMKCTEHLCENCRKRHNQSKLLKGHQVLSIKDKPSLKELLKLSPSYCEQHPNEEIKLYCSDCKAVTCLVCHATKHTNHKCSEINQSAEEFRGQLDDSITKISNCVKKRQSKLQLIEEDKKKFIDQVLATQTEISNKCDQLRSLINAHQQKLIEELDSFKVKHLKEIETRKDEDERHLLIMESFVKYCEELKEKGTACDISRVGDDLKTRAITLLESHEAQNKLQLNKTEFSFIAKESTEEDVKKLFGTLTFNELHDNLAAATHASHDEEEDHDSNDGVWGVGHVRISPRCSNCYEIGHWPRNCPLNDSVEENAKAVKWPICDSCEQVGHTSCACPLNENCDYDEPDDPRTCFICGQDGHISSECAGKRYQYAPYHCKQPGHKSRNYPNF